MNKEMTFNEIKNQTDTGYVNVFNRYPVALERGEGIYVWDTDGKKYADFLGGIAVNILGHGDKGLVSAIANQTEKLIHVSNLYYTRPQAELVRMLTDGTGFDKMFICNSGAEANEAAIKLVRRHSPKYKIVTALNSFHGRTLATLTATGQEKYSAPYRPLPEGFIYVPFNDTDALINALSESDVGAFMIEMIQGEGGVVPATKEYIETAAAVCRKRGILFVVDEIQTGMGRTGKLFGFEHYGISPDIITLAKGLGGGVPIGAMLAAKTCSEAFKAGDHGSTFGGNPLACAAGEYVFHTLTESGLIKKVAKTGEYFYNRLLEMKKSSRIEDVRGMGLLLGAQLPAEISGAKVVLDMLERGWLINCAGRNTLRFAPPYIVTEKEIDEMTAALADCLKNY